MKKKSFVIGVDVSKLTLDAHCYGKTHCLLVGNNPSGHRSFLKWIKKQISKDVEEVLVVMEYAGMYTYGFEKFLHVQGVDYVKRSALDIKRSAGMKRGKSDRADARMISQYGWYRREELKPMKPTGKTQQQLQQLMAHRDKLVSDKASYQVRLKELQQHLGEDLPAGVIKSTQFIVDVLTEEIKQVERDIEALLKTESSWQRNFELIRTVKGVGFVSAVHMLLVTENFTRFGDVRKFACYCGVAPFKNESGTSIRGKTRTSHLANKKIKSLLTMAAISAINHQSELKDKYQKKLQQGKAKMVALNMIRFELIERIFAVIKRQTPYVLRTAA
jgi:transposase